MDADKVCSLLNQLDIQQILFLGDSLSASQCASFLNKMGKDRISGFSHVNGTYQATLLCGNNIDAANFSISLQCTRQNGGSPFPDTPRENMTLRSETRDFLLGNSTSGKNNQHQKLLAVLNMGAHYHGILEYQEDLELLFQWIDSYTQPKDFIFFRTTPSGHAGCSPRQPRTFDFKAGIRDVPLASYQDFHPTTSFDWNLFGIYNSHTRRVVAERNGKRDNNLQHIQLLDVVNMTILRIDGHSGGPDCLHYVEPGPVDWWNHFLFTLLKKKVELTC
jgi:hypothetical protein